MSEPTSFGSKIVAGLARLNDDLEAAGSLDALEATGKYRMSRRLLDIAIRERPIIFSGPMVRALLDGRKTATRRVIRGVHKVEMPEYGPVDCIKDWDGCPSRLDWAPRNWEICPYGVAGERLWVRETWSYYRPFGGDPTDQVIYRADLDECGQCPLMLDGRKVWVNVREPWKPSIYMPRWASRITLEITDVRIERLQAISEDDAVAEGLQPVVSWTGLVVSARFRFEKLWDSLNGKRPGCAWADNPWCWTIAFRRLTP
ncbi:MAG: hypothetical protein AB7G11_02260 [Phycisphaerales bacterium]